MSDVIWTVADDRLTGAERCRLAATADGWRLAGVIAATLGDHPVDATYEVVVDPDWCTRAVSVTLDRLTSPRTLRLERSDDGTWTVDGAAAPHLDGCTDVDLGITPATNTLPIRRLGLGIGAEQDVEVAWVRFPDLRVDRGTQTYARTADTVWHYSSGSFAADLEVDADGLVVRYGDDLWQRVASA